MYINKPVRMLCYHSEITKVSSYVDACFFFQEFLAYKGSKVHRIVKDFIVQMGDITIGDGSGGKINSMVSE